MLDGIKWSNTPPTGPLMRRAETEIYLGISRPTLYRLVKRGVLPPPIKLGTGISAFSKAQIDAVIAGYGSEGGIDAN